MKKIIAVTIICCFFSVNLMASETVVRVRSMQSAADISHGYFLRLLTMILKNTEQTHGRATVKIIDISASQGRILKSLSQGQFIDIAWAGTNRERENQVHPIRIPLVGGLLGYRVPVIKKDNIDKFKKIRQLSDLKKLTAVQGQHWPDSDILEAAGLKISREPEFRFMYNILKYGRVDYFPRGLNEVYSEVKGTGDDELVVFDSLIIAYQFPMYFFTKNGNDQLAQRIEKGLNIAIDNGSFLKNMKEHSVTSSMFPLSKYKDSLIIHIKNPFLPGKTPINDSRLWIKLK